MLKAVFGWFTKLFKRGQVASYIFATVFQFPHDGPNEVGAFIIKNKLNVVKLVCEQGIENTGFANEGKLNLYTVYCNDQEETEHRLYCWLRPGRDFRHELKKKTHLRLPLMKIYRDDGTELPPHLQLAISTFLEIEELEGR